MRDLYVTFRKDFSADADKNMLAIPRKQRAMVRKGIQKGLQASVDQSVDCHYAMYSESLRNLVTPVFTDRYLRILLEVFGSDCEILTIRHGKESVASVMSFYFRNEVIPYYGGGTAAARAVAGNDYMYWAVMERARELGKSVFDYGRSKLGTGSYDFKSNWGFEPQPLYYEYYLVKAKSVPSLSPNNPKFSLSIKLWKKLPLGVARLLGPPLARYLG
jgi:FemAB-related protein (PEP-CTERM system-associated)